MPTVPRVTRQVSLERLPGARKDAAETFESVGGEAALAKGKAEAAKHEGSAAVADALGNIAGRVGLMGADVYRDLKRKEKDATDDAVALELETTYGSWWNKRRDDQETGVMVTHGEDALKDLPAKIDEERTALEAELEKKVTNPEQRAAWARIRANQRMRTDLELGRHLLTEAEQRRTTQLQAARELSVNNAIGYYKEPVRFQAELEANQQRLATVGPKFGMTKDEITVAQLKDSTRAHLGAIYSLLADNQDEAARRWFNLATGKDVDGKPVEGRQNQIDPEQWKVVKAAIEDGTLRRQSQVEAQRIIAEGGTYADMEKKAQALGEKNAKLQDEVIVRLKQHEDQRRDNERQFVETTRRRFADSIDAGVKQGRGPASIMDSLAADPSWHELSPEQRNGMASYLEAKLQPIATHTDMEEFDRLHTLMVTNPDKFLQTDLYALRGKLSEGDYKRFVEARTEMLQKRQPDPKLFNDAAAQKQAVDDTVDLMLGPDWQTRAKKDGGRIDARVGQFRRAVREAVDRQQAKNPTTPISDTEVRDIVEVLATPVGKKGGFFADQQYAFETAQARITRIDQVPPAQRRMIERLFREDPSILKRAWTDADIINEYNAHLARVRKDY